MNDGSKKKSELLGEPIGTASNKLRKIILFNYIKNSNDDICFRCGNKIDNIDDLSIEHKNSWMSSENPKESFYDLANITFSHLKCNTASSNRKVPHYNYRGENHPCAKLTNDKVIEIRNLLRLGYSVRKLAEKFNIGKSEIWKIKNNINWKE